MSESKENDFGSREATHRIWLMFDKHVQLLAPVNQMLLEQKGERWEVLVPLMYSVQDSCDSLSFLVQQGKVRDSFVIARTIFETIVNFCFILAGGDTVAGKAKRHAMQKSYRDLKRELDIGGQKLKLEWNGELDLSKNLDLQAAIDEYTSRKGREITSWTPETTVQQLEAVKNRYGGKAIAGLQFTLIAIYRHASEIAHGTLFGALFSPGLTMPQGPPNSPEAIAHHQRQNISMILLTLGLSISSMLHILSKEIELSTLVHDSKIAIEELLNESWFKDH
jgi:hypothetical protein